MNIAQALQETRRWLEVHGGYATDLALTRELIAHNQTPSPAPGEVDLAKRLIAHLEQRRRVPYALVGWLKESVDAASK